MFSDNMPKDWTPPERPEAGWKSLKSYILHLPKDDIRYVEFFRMEKEIETLRTAQITS